MNKKFRLALVAVLVISLLTFAGCSSTEKAKTETPQQEEKAPQKVVYKVGTEPTFPPFEFTNEKNEIVGFDIDLIKAIAEDQGFEVEVQQLGFDGLILALQSGNIDIAASGMSITPERLQQVDFSDPYIDAGLAIAVANNNETIKGVDDLKGTKVAVQIGTTGAGKAQELLEAGLIKEIKTFPTVDVVMMELMNGGVDAVINDLPVTEAYISKQPGKIKVVGDVLESDSYGFAVRKGNTELLEKINAGLKNLKENGKFEEIQNKYF
ncbi:MAG: basic amino acid ABC transporter substrate-binding protein [Clostridia bacterium]|nr:basic amino acid ABC transporter substrate-binding protein [Clostridia bacterium]